MLSNQIIKRAELNMMAKQTQTKSNQTKKKKTDDQTTQLKY